MSGAPSVGFIGLGNIGRPMAERLIDWPGGLTVCDVAPDATADFAARGAEVAATPAEVAAAATVISIMVFDDAQVRDVVTGPDGILSTASPGTVVAIHSTVEFGTPAELAEVATTSGVDIIDAPVSGGAMGAASATLALMVGGESAAVDRVREPFATFAGLVAHMGPVGAGTRAKLARNLITYASYTAAGEAARLAEATGVDLAMLGDVVRHSDRVTGGPGAIMVRSEAGPMAADDGLRPIFSHAHALGEKDLDMALRLAEEHDLDLPVTALTRREFGRALGLTDPTD